MSASDKGSGADAANSDRITRLLAEVRQGDRRAIDLVFKLVYAELHKAAKRQLAGARFGQTLNTTVLVHEAYLKLVASSADWTDRGHFFAVAARQMRRILVDHAKTRFREKRGGTTTGSLTLPALALSAALGRSGLARSSPTKSIA